MNTTITTDEGVPSRVEANLAVALKQGRIAYSDLHKWRDMYAKAGYEKTTQALLSRPANPDALQDLVADRRSVRPPTGRGFAVGEGAYRAYAAACGIPGLRGQPGATRPPETGRDSARRDGAETA